MTNIDDVIERARQPGEFTERREFTVARDQAIEKLRKFALVKPHYYILELIQSAVANGATYIDIQCGRREMMMSYVGGSFEKQQLGRLFDFLFAAQDDLEQGALRQLALGVNALMHYEPDEIIVESGDGTTGGTSRITIHGEDRVEVGTPDRPLEGTFVRTSGMSGRPLFQDRPREYRAVQDRCLVAPVPILFNHEPVFGYSSQRTPKSLYGFTKTISFDEGDLYGTIGLARRHSGAVFRILTHGVWIQSTRHSFEVGGDRLDTLGGVVTYDRLRKTADHSSIVEDERYDQMWARIKPYVHQLLSDGVQADDHQVRTLVGDEIEGRELMELFHQVDGVVMVPPEAAQRGEAHDAALKIGESLGLPVLCVPEGNREDVKTLAGGDVEFVVPDLGDDEELHFYTRNEDRLPARPWLTAPVDLGNSSFLDVVEAIPVSPLDDSIRPQLSDADLLDETSMPTLRKAIELLDDHPGDEESLTSWKQRTLDPLGESIHATVYTPQDQRGESRRANVEVRSAGRVVWKGNLPAVADGQVVVIDVAGLSPQLLWSVPLSRQRARPGWGLLEDCQTMTPPLQSRPDQPVARYLAEGVLQNHLSELEQVADRGLRAALRTDVEPNSSAARLVLASLVPRVVKRIRAGNPRIRFSIVDDQLDDRVLDIPLVVTLTGDSLSLRDIEQLMHDCHGRLYALRTDIDHYIDQVEKSRILEVDEPLERLLISLIGSGAYVQLNARDMASKYVAPDRRVLTLELPMVGLRGYPDFPLLIECGRPDDFDVEHKKLAVDELVAGLLETVKEEHGEYEGKETGLRRRQAWRHLQWFAFYADDYDYAQEAVERVRDLPLFGLADGRTCSPAVLKQVIERQGHVEMLDGWASGISESTFNQASARQVTDVAELDDHPLGFELQMDPYVLHLLGDVVCGVAEYELSPAEMEAVEQPDVAPQRMLHQVIIDNQQAQGVIGVPYTEVDRPAVLVFSEETRRTICREDVAQNFGVIGKVRLRKGVKYEQSEENVSSAAYDVLAELLAQIPQLAANADARDYHRALEVLLNFAAGQLRLIAGADNTVDSNVRHPLAVEILNTPLFPAERGTPVSAMTLIYDFQDQAGSAIAASRGLDYQPQMVADELPEVLQRWIDRQLCIERIDRSVQPQKAAPTSEQNEHRRNTTVRCIERTLEHWLNTLHPDTDLGVDATLHIHVRVDDQPFEDERAGRFCQLWRPDDLGDNRLILMVNPQHWMTRWIAREGDQSQRAIAWPLLAGYAHVNAVLDVVTDEHELICQQRVAEAMRGGKLEMKYDSGA